MKLHFPEHAGMRGVAERLRVLTHGRSELSGPRAKREQPLARVRRELGHVVSDALTSSLGVLEDHLLGRRHDAASAQRLRDVVQQDRALHAVHTEVQRKSKARSARVVDPERAEATVAHEPIRTRTMAQLLAGQGYRKRALAIYEELLARAPHDEALQREAAELRD